MKNQLFRISPDLKISTKLLNLFGISDFNDNHSFTKFNLQELDTVNKMKELCRDNSILASVGPCIGNQSYEVNEDFCENFKSQNEENSLFFKDKGNDQLLFDIRGFVNKKLELLGIKDIDNIDMDTFQDPENFYSYRRSKKLQEPDYGRCISTICLKT